MSAFDVWENVITCKERYLVISILGGVKIRRCQRVQWTKLWKICPFSLSPGGLQAMSSHLLKASSSSASRLDLIDPLIDSLIHLYICTLYVYSLWMILSTLTIFSHDSQILISRSDLFPWIHSHPVAGIVFCPPCCCLCCFSA